MMARSLRQRLAAGVTALLLCAALGTMLRSTRSVRSMRHAPPHTVTPGGGASMSTLMRKWVAAGGGGAPRALRVQCAASSPADAVRGVLGAFERGLVVDVGANGGWPASVYALRAGARVISIEPDERNLVRLRRLSSRLKARSSAGQHTVVAAAAGAAPATQRMAFHRKRNDFTCFRCLGMRNKDVYTRNVKVVTVDSTLRSGGGDAVRLLKSDTQGHELEVIRGAQKAFATGSVRAALIEFDPGLLGRRATALALLRTLHGHGMGCVHMRFSGKAKRGAPRLRSFPIRNTRRSEERFYDYVVRRGGWTDLLCLRIAQ